MAFIAPPQADMGFGRNVHAEVELAEQRVTRFILRQAQPDLVLLPHTYQANGDGVANGADAVTAAEQLSSAGELAHEGRIHPAARLKVDHQAALAGRDPRVGAGEAYMDGRLVVEPPHDIRDMILFVTMNAKRLGSGSLKPKGLAATTRAKFQHSKTHALVTWWLLPAAKTSLASPISQQHPYAL